MDDVAYLTIPRDHVESVTSTVLGLYGARAEALGASALAFLDGRDEPHPATHFVGLHFGCFMSWVEVRRMLATHGNYRVDTAAGIADIGRETSARSATSSWTSATACSSAPTSCAPRYRHARPRAAALDLREYFERHGDSSRSATRVSSTLCPTRAPGR
jgi:hypothetical protein